MVAAGIVFLLHGTGGSAAQFTAGFEENEVIKELVNDGFAVTDGRVDDDAVRGGHVDLDDSDSAGLVEFGIPQRLPGRPLGRIAP